MQGAEILVVSRTRRGGRQSEDTGDVGEQFQTQITKKKKKKGRFLLEIKSQLVEGF